MPLTAIVLHVVRPGGRADELLAGLASHLGRAMHPADERGHVRILLEQPEGPAWQRVHDALEAAGDDWEEHLHLNPRPGPPPSPPPHPSPGGGPTSSIS